MLNWILMLFVFSLTSCLVGYGGLVGGLPGIAKALLLIFFTLIAISIATQKGNALRSS